MLGAIAGEYIVKKVKQIMLEDMIGILESFYKIIDKE